MKNLAIQKLKESYKIYKCSNWENKNGEWCSITYAAILGNNAVSTETTITIEWKGGRWESLYTYIF